jgi:CheY-like chemotaxis protein
MPDNPLTGKKILMVDEELYLIGPYIEVLKDEGYEITTISNVDDALKHLQNHTFDLITLDVLMPPSKEQVSESNGGNEEKTGLWFFEKIRANPAFRKIPIIFITVTRSAAIHNEINAIEERYTGHKAQILTKPVMLRELLRTVEGALRGG